MKNAFICDIASFLPNAPVENEAMEGLLGRIQGLPSRSRRIILRNNGILRRHYAIDPETGRQTHTNAQLTAEAVRRLRPEAGFRLEDLDCLCCGTASPDQIMPGHASMVHGELGGGPCETVSPAGVCISAMAGLKYAALSVSAGTAQHAVATGSELASTFTRASYLEGKPEWSDAELEAAPELAFNAEFLRWMLSDGAGAAYLRPEPLPGRPALRIEWIEMLSFAHELPVCMYAGGVKRSDGTLQGWREFPSPARALAADAFAIQQDVRLLNEEIIKTSVDRALLRVRDKHALDPESIDWFLPHYSSDYFRGRLHDRMRDQGFPVPYEKWFTNLETCGNTGSASIFLILEELLASGRLRRGQRLLCFIPESGRFSICYVLLEAV